MLNSVFCYSCKAFKQDHEFSNSQKHIRFGSLKGRCKTCSNAMNKKWRMENPEQAKDHAINRKKSPEHKEGDRIRALQRKYGLTAEQYDSMRTSQDFKCFLCAKPEDVGTRWGCLHVDHDHGTGSVRRLLCHQCNSGLGCFKDSQELLLKAANYLQQHVTN